MRLRGIQAESGVVYPRGLRYFFEVSPRPHDTGLVSLISQNLSQFALHARAILGLPIPSIDQFGPSASAVIMGEGQSQATRFSDVDKALSEPGTAIRLFGKPDISGSRHLGVSVASAETIVEARKKACTSAQAIRVQSE